MATPPLGPDQPTAPILPPPAPRERRGSGQTLLAVLVGVLVLALIATSAIAVAQSRAASAARAENQALAAEITQLREEVAELERELEAARRAPLDGLDGLDGLEGLEDFDPRQLLEEFFGSLFGDGSEPGSGDGSEPGSGDGLGGLFDGLFDGLPEGLLDGLLDGTLGDPGTPAAASGRPGAACLQVVATDGTGDLGGFLGGLTDPRPPAAAAADDLAPLVARVSDEVAAIRQLRWRAPATATLADDAAITTRLRELTAPDAEELRRIEVAERVLIDLGALAPDDDLQALRTDLLEAGVAGFYVPETGELVVRAEADEPLDPADRVVLAHELEHALVDQTLGLPDLTEPPWRDDTTSGPYRDDRDAALAMLAVVEGSASLTMHLWALAHLGLDEQLAMALDPTLVGAQRAMDDLPPALVAELLFPYTDGLEWVCRRWLEDGWAAVDAAYADPPTTTAEILTGTAVTASTPPPVTPVGGYGEVVAIDTFGAAELLWHLEAPGGEPGLALDRPRERVRAWGGGTVTSLSDGRDHATVLSLIDAEVTGVPPLCETMTDLAAAADPTGVVGLRDGRRTVVGTRSSLVHCDGDLIRLAVAGDLRTATALSGG